MTEMSLGQRMKNCYELASTFFLMRRTPVILRLDGKCFHTFTRGCNKPFDRELSNAMCETTSNMCQEIQGAKFAYTQSDEISILLTDYDNLDSSAWFDYKIQKMCSVAASMCTDLFAQSYVAKRGARFDARVFNLPPEEVVNYFVWRQKDWIRNSIQMVAQSMYSQKQLHGKSNDILLEMIQEEGCDWNTISKRWKYGNVVYRPENKRTWCRESAFVFTDNRKFFDKYLLDKE